jgi:hypothetical protein
MREVRGALGAFRDLRARGVRAPDASDARVRRPTVVRASRLVLALSTAVAASVFACAAAPPRPEPARAAAVGAPSSAVAAPVGGPSSDHPSAVARLASAPWGPRLDKRTLVVVPLADAAAWTHVSFWGVTTLAGWRYGDEHHAVAAAFTFAPPAVPATLDGCAERFTTWGRSKARRFDLIMGEPRVEEPAWNGGFAGSGAHARVYVVDADRRSVFGAKRYFAAYAVMPAWRDACLVVGFAVPGSGAMDDARAVRDRWARDGVAAIEVRADAGARALEPRTFD